MTRIVQIKTNFTSGEVGRDLLGRGDLRAYENGAAKLRNVFIFPTGGITRRAGTYFIDAAPGAGRLVSFEFSTEQTYLLALFDRTIRIYQQDTLIETLDAPWTQDQLPQLAWTQSADTLLLTHPDVPPKKLTRTAAGWTLGDWVYIAETGALYQPYYKFAAAAITLTPSATTGTITLTASSAVFMPDHENTRLRIGGKDVVITDYQSPTVVTAIVQQTLLTTQASVDWQEQAFSPVRGYPVSSAFHQDRLVIGGSRDLPNRLWFSRSGDLFNFNLGEGNDDESIEFAILSDQVNAIRSVFSGRHLQVFTSGAEWAVIGDPLTPSNVQLRRQTRVGAMTDRMVQPIEVDGATLFIARNGREVREFIYTDLEQAYQSNDLALLARHIIERPIDQDFDKKRRLLFLVRADGQIATLTLFRSEQVSAWTLHNIGGTALAVSVVDNTVYILVRRGNRISIESFDDTARLDSALYGTSPTPTPHWSGLDHLNGNTVSIIADGRIVGSAQVTDGSVTIAEPAASAEIGLPFTHVIEPLPVSLLSDIRAARAFRLTEAIFRIQDTQALRVDVGRGFQDVPLRTVGGDVLDEPPPIVSTDVRVRALGWIRDFLQPVWRIEQEQPLAFTLLSVTTELKVND